MTIITRRIEIDAGHRIPDHSSKCRHIHGHRYVIKASCAGALVQQGSETGMVMDFSFLKADMIEVIHDYADHNLLLFKDDPLLEFLAPDFEWQKANSINLTSQMLIECSFGKILVIDSVPTAENLAYHWYQLLKSRITQRCGDRVQLVSVRVEETPNCSATCFGGL